MNQSVEFILQRDGYIEIIDREAGHITSDESSQLINTIQQVERLNEWGT